MQPAFGIVVAGDAGAAVAATTTGGFFNAPDFNEIEKMDQRLTALEGKLMTSIGGYTSFQADFKVMQGNFTQLSNRVGDMERDVQKLAATVADIKRQQESFQTAELSRESRYANLERQLQRLDNRLRAHGQNAAMHSQDETNHYGVEGFRANDQPREFMGSRR
tara:strand:- start:388 stop:876 length:489 start_codon:yes stop_codon:yes gene_type:complete